MKIVKSAKKSKITKKSSEPLGAALRSEKYGLNMKMYPFSHTCPHCGQKDMITYDGKFFIETFPMGSTKKALGEGSKKARAKPAETSLDEEESY